MQKCNHMNVHMPSPNHATTWVQQRICTLCMLEEAKEAVVAANDRGVERADPHAASINSDN